MPNHRPIIAFVCLLFVAGLVRSGAGDATAPASRYSVRTWENDEGLPQNSVLSIVQTRDGYLWVGTFNGLVRFNGTDFRNLTPELNDRIVHLFEDSRGALWIGTENRGTLKFEEGRLTAPPELAAGGFERRLRAACEDKEGAVWLYYENGDLWRCAPGRPQRAFVTPRDFGTRTMISETNGPVWIGTLHHQYAVGGIVENGSFELPVEQDIGFSRLDALVASYRGGYWRLANTQVQRVHSGANHNILDSYPWSHEISAACEDRDGNLVVGTKGSGVFIIGADGAVTSISTNDNLSANTILAVFADRDGTLWVGTDGGGLNRVRRNRFQVLESTRNWVVQSVAADVTSSVWVGGSYNFGLGHWNGSKMTRFGPFPDPVPVQCVFVDREQRVWLSTLPISNRGMPSGLFQFRDGRLQNVDDRGLIRSVVQSIYQDRASNMWFGTGNGLVCFSNLEWRVFSGGDGLTSTNITAIADDGLGTIWIGTRRGGVNRLERGKISSSRKADGAPSDDIAGLHVDEQNVLWVTTPAGLGRFEKGQWTRYTTNIGMVSDDLGYLLDDQQGNLWIGSNLGLLLVSRESLNQFAHGETHSVTCRAYGKPDGLPTRECTFGSQPGAWRGANGTLWFSTSKGAASLSLSQFRMNTNPPPVIIEAVLVDDVPRNDILDRVGSTSLVLQPGDERLEIHYASLNLGAPDRARFRYRLVGYEKDWTEAGNERVAHYTRLTPGEYKFHVLAANEDGFWNEAGTALGIVVLPPPPPLWKRAWFIAATTACLIGIIVAVVHYLSTQKLQRQLAVLRQQEALERERARIARDIHDQVGASLTQVALLGELVETDKDSPEEVQSHAQQISQTARETTRALDEIVWTVNPQNDTLEGLVNYICKYAQDYLAVAGLRYRFDLPAELPARVIAPDVRHNVFLASKEAVTNVVRHAKASAAWVRLKLEPDSFTIEIEDNGRGVAGLDPDAPRTRNGLKNMRKRMEDVGGTFSIGPGSEGGALVCLKVPLSKPMSAS